MFTTDQLRHINSMTKYPSIETYHKLDPKTGMLQEEPTSFGDSVVFCTEKIDGTNCRIIVFPDGDWIIGSREELLTCRDDRIANPALGIVGSTRMYAEELSAAPGDALTVFYGEVYGGGIGGQWKNYTKLKGHTAFRLFDVATIDGYEDMLDWPIEKVAAWRDGGSQRWAGESDLLWFVTGTPIHLVPRILTLNASELPTSIDVMHKFLSELLPGTFVALQAGDPGRAEGLVLRNEDRSVIAKARFEDYHRTLKRRPRS